MTIQVFHYPACSTCKKADKWLKEHELEAERVHIVEAPPSKEMLREAMERGALPLRKLFNTSGQSYRQGGFKERLPEMTEDEALEALAADGKLIKRPLVLGKDVALVGFKEADWEAALLG